MLLVAANSPFKTLGDVLAAARAKPGSLSYGMSGIGTSTHLAGELFKYMAKVNITAVSYKGGARRSTTCWEDISRCPLTTFPNRSARSGAAACACSA